MIAGQIEIQMMAEITRLAKQLDEAEAHVRGFVGRVDRLAGLAGTALGAIGAGLSAGALADFFKRAIDGAAAMHDLTMQTGMTVDRLSALQEIGRGTDTTLDDIGSAANKLQKNLAGIDSDASGVGAALKSIGLDYKTFADLHPDEQLVSVAKALDKFEDGTGKSAVAMALLGKEGAKMLPFLKDLADAQTMQGRISAEQAALADEFGDALAKLKGEVEGTAMQFALNLLPIIQKATGLIEPALKVTALYLALFHALPALLTAGYAAFNMFALSVYNGTTALGVFNASMTATVAITKAAVVQFGLLNTAALAVVAAFAGWEIGTWLRENFLEAQLAGIAFVQGALLGWESIKAGAAIAWAGIKSAAGSVLEWVGGAFAGQVETIGKSMQAIGMQDSGAAVLAWAQNIRMATTSSSSFAAEVERIGREADAAKQQIRGITDDMAAEAIAAFHATKAAKEKKKELKDTAAAAAAAAKAYEALRKQYAGLISASKSNVAAMEAEASGAAELTQGEKRLLEMQAKIEDGTLKYEASLYRAAAAQFQAEAQTERRIRTERALQQALSEAAKHQTKLADAEAQSNEQLRQQLVAEQERVEQLRMTQAALRAKETATMRATAADLEWQAATEGGNAALEERARLLRALADRRDVADATQTAKDADKAQLDAAESAAKASTDVWTRASDDISQALTNALMDGGKTGSDYVVGYLRAAFGRGLQGVMSGTINSALGFAGSAAGSAAGGGAGGAGGYLNMASSAYSAYAAGGLSGLFASNAAYGAAIGSTSIGTGSQAAMLAAQTGEFGWAGLSATAASGAGAGTGAAAGGASAGGMSSLAALGWAAVVAAVLYAIFGDHSKWSMGVASEGAFGADGAFGYQRFDRFDFGRNTEHERDAPFQAGLRDAIASGIAGNAAYFGGKASGFGIGVHTDADRDNEIAALLRIVDAGGNTLAGVQTGSGAFGAGGPGGSASKIHSDDLQKWIAENLPVAIVQGLQQSDLTDRFDTYFDSVAASALTPELAQQMLATASAVQQLTDAFGPLGGVFLQLETMSVTSVENLVKAAGGVDALGQSVGTYYQAFYSEAERTQDQWDDITRILKEAGVNTLPTTKAEFRDLVNSLADLGTEADQRAFVALMKVSGAFSSLVDSADAAAASLMDRLTQAIDTSLPKLLSAEEQRALAYHRIQSDLAKAGVSIDMAALMGASREQILAFARSFIDLTDGASEAEIAVATAAGALADMADSAVSSAHKMSTAEGLRTAAAARAQVDQMAQIRQAFTSQLAAGRLGYGLQSYVDGHWGGAGAMPGSTMSALFNEFGMRYLSNDIGAMGGLTAPAVDRLASSSVYSDNSARDQAEADQLKAMQDLIASLRQVDGSLNAWRSQWQLGEMSNLDPLQQYELAGDNLASLFAQAQAGSVQAFTDWQQAADAFMGESNSYFGGGTGAAADREAVFGMWQELQRMRASMETSAQRTVDAIERTGAKTAKELATGNAIAKEAVSESKHQASSRIGFER